MRASPEKVYEGTVRFVGAGMLLKTRPEMSYFEP
jgi:hypothetical protein